MPEVAPEGQPSAIAPVSAGPVTASGATPAEPPAIPVPVSADAAPDGSAPPAPRSPALVAPAPGLDDGNRGCTAAQLRRFIKSRSYVPLHELRRRFELNGRDDEVSPVRVEGRTLFVGLPPREASLLGELLGQGDIGFELLLDPASPLIVGVYPMRPVSRT